MFSKESFMKIDFLDAFEIDENQNIKPKRIIRLGAYKMMPEHVFRKDERKETGFDIFKFIGSQIDVEIENDILVIKQFIQK